MSDPTPTAPSAPEPTPEPAFTQEELDAIVARCPPVVMVLDSSRVPLANATPVGSAWDEELWP